MSKLPPLPHWCESGSPFAEQMQAYAIAATEPLLQRIAELERQLHEQAVSLEEARAQIGQGEPDGWREFVQRVADQKPEKPDYWSACGQCERNISDAEDLIASAPQAPQQKPIGWLYDWTHSSALGKPDEHFTSFTTDEEHARKHSNARPVFEAAHNIGEKK